MEWLVDYATRNWRVESWDPIDSPRYDDISKASAAMVLFKFHTGIKHLASGIESAIKLYEDPRFYYE
jgi:hypothetical protein